LDLTPVGFTTPFMYCFSTGIQELFEDPELFNPDRYLATTNGTKPDPVEDVNTDFLFGSGRVRLFGILFVLLILMSLSIENLPR